MKDVLPCIICKKKLECAIEGFPEQPIGALVFSSAGNFGSSLFKGEVGELFLVICDDCAQILSRKDQVGYRVVTEAQTIVRKLAKF